jgi:4-amino-4-deoxy-L-arabinose transferase-like glycosyltransferase
MKMPALLRSNRVQLLIATSVLLAAAFLRFHRLADQPPGWRDDEVTETLVHARIVLSGALPLYFPQAEGHEPLYHWLSGGWIALVGQSLFAVRLLSAFFGVVSVAALYRLARRQFGARVALLVAALLAVSFWSLMYSRFKLRHISEVGLMLLSIDFFWQSLQDRSSRQRLIHAGLAGLLLGICLYTYYAARVVPLVLAVFCLYLLVFHRSVFSASWRAMLLVGPVAVILSAPMALAIAAQPGGEARLGVIGAPLQALLRGDLAPAAGNTLATLGMFAFSGDPEFLYNVPGRPVFEVFGAVLFLAGLGLCLWRWRQPASALLLIWLTLGMAPAFLSTPAASLGHTIAAQPVFYLLPAVALSALAGPASGAPSAARGARAWLRQVASPRWRAAAAGLCAALLLGITAARDLRDYFMAWPALPDVRHLYRADLHEAAQWLNSHGSTLSAPAGADVAVASRALHPADLPALLLDAPRLDLRLRLFQPERALVLPAGSDAQILIRETAPGEAGALLPGWPPPLDGRAFVFVPPPAVATSESGAFPEAAFENGLVLVGYWATRDTAAIRLVTQWRVDAGYQAPPSRSLAVLTAQDVPLRIFTHLLGADGALLAGDDRFDLDPADLRPGDQFLQLSILPVVGLPAGELRLQVGLYRVDGGARILLTTGDDAVTLPHLRTQP